MTIQTLFDAWIASGVNTPIEAPATEAEIQAAEEKIGAQLPTSLREVYQLFNGDWLWDLDFYQLEINEHGFGLVNANEKYIEWRVDYSSGDSAVCGNGRVGCFWHLATRNGQSDF